MTNHICFASTLVTGQQETAGRSLPIYPSPFPASAALETPAWGKKTHAPQKAHSDQPDESTGRSPTRGAERATGAGRESQGLAARAPAPAPAPAAPRAVRIDPRSHAWPLPLSLFPRRRTGFCYCRRDQAGSRRCRSSMELGNERKRFSLHDRSVGAGDRDRLTS